MPLRPSREQIMVALKAEWKDDHHPGDKYLVGLLKLAHSELASIQPHHNEQFGYGRRTVFGTFLGMLRQNKGVRLGDTARAAGIDSATASRFENEAGLPDRETLRLLADYFCPPTPPKVDGGLG